MKKIAFVLSVLCLVSHVKAAGLVSNLKDTVVSMGMDYAKNYALQAALAGLIGGYNWFTQPSKATLVQTAIGTATPMINYYQKEQNKAEEASFDLTMAMFQKVQEKIKLAEEREKLELEKENEEDSSSKNLRILNMKNQGKLLTKNSSNRYGKMKGTGRRVIQKSGPQGSFQTTIQNVQNSQKRKVQMIRRNVDQNAYSPSSNSGKFDMMQRDSSRDSSSRLFL